MSAPDPGSIASALAQVWSTADPDEEQLVALGQQMLGQRWRQLKPLARRLLKSGAWPQQGKPHLNQVIVLKFLHADQTFQRFAGRAEVLTVFRTAGLPSPARLARINTIASHLASALLGGSCSIDELVQRGSETLGKRWRWLRPLARRIQIRFAEHWRPGHPQLVTFLRQDDYFRRACRRHAVPVSGLQLRSPEIVSSVERARAWNTPPLRTSAELAEWLQITLPQLDWLADVQGRERHSCAGPLRHYRYQWMPKRRCGAARLIEAPKYRLRKIQTRILREILEFIPAHSAAHGYRRQRNTLSFVEPHVRQEVVIRTDLRDFFPSITSSRVAALFRAAGFPEPVSWLLTGLCTNRVPEEIWRSFPTYGPAPFDQLHHRQLYETAHLPQGAPTSPALANLCCYRLDARLLGLARSLGGNYTRYADDLLFSGGEELRRASRRLLPTIMAIAREEGFAVHAQKTRIMLPSGRQIAVGLVLNAHRNIRREEFDRLKATLHNCVRFGPAGQNRALLPDFRAHLLGRVGYVETVCPARGGRLRKLFEQIEWRDGDASEPVRDGL